MTVATPTAPTATPKVKTAADVLRHAAWIIEERGWCQYRMQESRTGRVCALGAITLAGSGHVGTANATVHAALLAVDRTLGRGVPAWNDERSRTAADVIAALRAAADASERAS